MATGCEGRISVAKRRQATAAAATKIGKPYVGMHRWVAFGVVGQHRGRHGEAGRPLSRHDTTINRVGPPVAS
jgi:hypothetical protein